MKIVIIGDRSLVLGFALAGVKEGFVVIDIDTVREAFSRCIERTDIGIILIGTEAATLIPEEIHNARRSSRLMPVITIVPGKRDEKSSISMQDRRDEKVQECLIR